MRRRLLLAAALIMVGGAFVAWLVWYPSPDNRPDEREQTLMVDQGVKKRDVDVKDLEDLVTSQGLAVARGADRAEFFKQHIVIGNPNWTITRRAAATPSQLAKARDVLLTPGVYSWGRRGGHKKCGGFQPRDVVRFWRGKESVTFLICFTCADVGVIYHDAAGHARTWMIADVHPGIAQLKQIREIMFPAAADEDSGRGVGDEQEFREIQK